MNQIAAFLSPAALPNAAGAVAHAGQAAAPDEGFANVLAQLQALVGAPAATKDGVPAQFQNLLGTTAVESESAAGANPPVQIGGTSPDTPVQLQSPFDLLGLIGSQRTDQTQTVGAPDASNAGTSATLAAQLAALQLALQNVQTQPNGSEPSAPTNAVADQSAPAIVAMTLLGLRGTLAPAQGAAQTDEKAQATNQQAATPQATNAAATLAALSTTQAKQDANAPQLKNIAKLPTAPKHAANAARIDTAAQTQPQAPAQNPKAPDTAVSNAPTTVAAQLQNPPAQHTAADQSGTANSQPAAAAPVLPSVISAQQFSVTVAAAPQAAVPLEALAIHIARKFEGGASQFEIRLHPAELGQLDISLSVADDGRVQAVLRAERPETLDILQRDARTLEQQLRQAGLDVGSNALSFSLSNGNGGRQAPFAGWPAFADANDAAGTAKEEAALKYVAVRTRDGVDIRV